MRHAFGDGTSLGANCRRATSSRFGSAPASDWHILPEQAQGRKAIWDAVDEETGIRRIDQAFPESLRASTSDQGMGVVASEWIRIAEKRDPAERVNAIRQLLPKCVFNYSPNVIEGLEALRSYRVDYDEKNATPRQEPKHDWSSHPTDAFGELAMQLRRGELSMRQPIAASDYDPMRIGQPDYMRQLTHEALEDDRRWTRQETAGISDYDPYKQ